MRYFLLLFTFIFIFSSSAFALTEETLYHDGIERVFLVHVPDNLKDKRGLPMVMALHGGGGSAEQFAGHIKMEQTANAQGFILVYPQGTAKRGNKMNTWNAAGCCSYAKEQNIDDVSFISKLIDFMGGKYGIDLKRVYSTGHSNGAMMSYRLACELSDKITAIAPNGGQDQLQNCDLKRAVPVLHIHGKEDKCARYDGGEQCGGCFQEVFKSIGIEMKPQSNTGMCHPVVDTVQKWAKLDGCAMDTQVTFQKGDVTCDTYSNCKGGAEVTLCTIENAGHTWPGASKSLKMCERRPNSKMCQAWQSQIGDINMDINANDFMWQFFAKHKIN